ncbi:hypothetical protein C0Z17_02695 [Trinickia caryophylli]|nr:hypothetical protein C0Z17_02695 [Trinickia caryophylli]
MLNVKNKAGVLDPTIAKNIAEIDAVDKRIGQETLVVRDGLMNHFNPTQRTVFLPAGHDNPVTASHELQHARDFAKLDALPTQEVLERRAFSAQQKTAQHLGIDDELKGQTPEQRAASHSQIKKT